MIVKTVTQRYVIPCYRNDQQVDRDRPVEREAIFARLSQSHKLTIENPKGSNEHPADHRSNNVESVPMSENSNIMTISDLSPGDTLGDIPSIGAKPAVFFFFLFFLLFNLYFTIRPVGHLVNFSNLIAK